jgi:hypothetical protein
LAQGVPMVAIPIAFDQPGISARIAHLGVGEFVDNPKGAYEPQNALIISRKYSAFCSVESDISSAHEVVRGLPKTGFN